MPQYTIGSLAQSCGLRPDTIRYYERLGLIESAGRKGNGYRVFTDDSLARLQFIRRAKLLNFTLEEIKDLFLMRSAPTSNCEQIYQRLSGKITDIDAQIVELTSFKRDLQTIAKQCPRGSAPLADCSLMDFLNKPAPCCAGKKIQKNKLKPKNAVGKALLIFAFCFLSVAAQAKPIPYTGGWMIMQENNTKENLLHIVYGLSPSFSAGVSSEWFKDKEYWLHSAQLNYLVGRKNLPDAQANLFLMSGVGAALKDLKPQPAAWAGILADYETRRILIAYDNNLTFAHTIETSFSQKIRAGVAPYIGKFDDVHTWLMVQFEHYPNTNHEYVVTPLVRLFKDNYLGEIGYSSNHKIMINWNVTF